MKNMRVLKKVAILSRALGDPKSTNSDVEFAFRCPFCIAGYDKYKLGINIAKGVGHCWICEWKGSIATLLRKIHLPNLVSEYYDTPLIPEENAITKKEEELDLPEGYTHVLDMEDGITKDHIVKHLLRDRGLTPVDLSTYNIGFTTEGEYAFRIIVPSYNEDAKLTYFVTRAIYPDAKKYKNPSISKNKVIFNEWFIDWKSKVVLVEGVFDALVTPNAIPLLGKEVHNLLIDRLVKEGTKDVVIALDGDAEGVKASHKVFMKLEKYGIKAKIAELPPGKDLSDLGINRQLIKTIISNAEYPNLSSILF